MLAFHKRLYKITVLFVYINDLYQYGHGCSNIASVERRLCGVPQVRLNSVYLKTGTFLPTPLYCGCSKKSDLLLVSTDFAVTLFFMFMAPGIPRWSPVPVLTRPMVWPQ